MPRAFVLTPNLLRATYNMVCELAPFDQWNLPDGDEVVFQVTSERNTRGWHTYSRPQHTIGVSSICVQRYDTLVQTMMHEMIHAHERNVKQDRTDVYHSRAFHQWAAQVCRIHKLDAGIF